MKNRGFNLAGIIKYLDWKMPIKSKEFTKSYLMLIGESVFSGIWAVNRSIKTKALDNSKFLFAHAQLHGENFNSLNKLLENK